MSGPQELHISFRHLNADYDINLVKGEKSDHCVEINGVKYAVLGDREKLDIACEILTSVSLNSISNTKDLQEKLSLRGDISFPQAQKTDDVGIKTLKTTAISEVREIGVEEKAESPGITRVNKYIDALKDSDFYSGIVMVAVGGKPVRQEIIRPKGLEQKEFTEDTPFNILSVGKLFTTVAIMQLVQDGVISLNTPINKKGLLERDDYTLEGCDEHYKSTKLDKGDLESFMNDDTITIQHLLTHTSGLVETPVLADSSHPTHYDKSRVGKENLYSNFGFQLLARIVKNSNKEKLSFNDYVKNHIMKKSGMEEEGSIRFLAHPPEEDQQSSHFSTSRPSGQPRGVDSSLIPGPDGNGCFWMTASDLQKFANAFEDGTLLSKETKESILKKDPAFANSPLGFADVEGDGSESSPRIMAQPGAWKGGTSGLCTIKKEGEDPVTLIFLSNFTGGSMILPEMWDTVLKEGPPPKPLQFCEHLRSQYIKLKSLEVNDRENIKKIIEQFSPGIINDIMINLEEEDKHELTSVIVEIIVEIEIELKKSIVQLKSLEVDDRENINKIIEKFSPGIIADVMIDLEEENKHELISVIVKILTSSNIDGVARSLENAGNTVTLEKVKQAQQKMKGLEQ